jgi:hypothetical protein
MLVGLSDSIGTSRSVGPALNFDPVANRLKGRGMPSVPGFLPSTHAPLFRNGPWPAGLKLMIRVAGLPVLSLDAIRWGLCGGMAFLTRDIVEAGQPQLCARDPSRVPLALAHQLLRRQIDSIKRASMITRWLAATWQPDHGTRLWGRSLAQVTVAECSAIMRDIDAGRLCPVGLVAARRWIPWDVFKNHVVLVWGYERAGDWLTLYTYDSNFPGRDDITLRLNLNPSGHDRKITTNGTDGPTAGCVRGFFRVPYRYANPPQVSSDGLGLVGATQR